MKQFLVTLTKQGQPAMKIVVHAQNQQDARRQALSMHQGWNVNRIDD
jgi:antitoxin (DNA-binding transcriptional repressor) of toxin-antitoxin stability system